jgi:hypothetical protein
MALNSSGPISLAGSTTGESVAIELGLSPTGQISLNDDAVRTLLAKTGQYSEISLLDAYGKSSSISFASEYNFNDVFQKVIGTRTFDTYGQFRGINCKISGDGRTFAITESYIDNNDTSYASNARTRSTGILSVYCRSYTPNIGYQWNKEFDQIFIDGTYPSNFGQGLDLSYDGNTLAVGSFTNGTRIYIRNYNQYVNPRWQLQTHITPAGSTSPSQSGTDNGASCVSLSGDGNTLAIGNPDWFNGSVKKGAIIIYERIGTTWTSRHGWIRGSDYQATSNFAIKFGVQLKLDFAGKLLIVGVDNYTDSFNIPEYYYQSGVTSYGAFRKARIYERNNGTWSLTSTIEGNREAGNTMDIGLLIGNASKVSVSADGKVIAVSSIIEGYGSFWNPGSGYGSGLVRVYRKGFNVYGTPIWSLFQVLYDPNIQTTTYSNPPLYGSGLNVSETGKIIVVHSTSKIYFYQSKDGAAYELKQSLTFDTWNNSFVNYSAAGSITPDAKKFVFGIRDNANTTLPTFLPVSGKLYSSSPDSYEQAIVKQTYPIIYAYGTIAGQIGSLSSDEDRQLGYARADPYGIFGSTYSYADEARYILTRGSLSGYYKGEYSQIVGDVLDLGASATIPVSPTDTFSVPNFVPGMSYPQNYQSKTYHKINYIEYYLGGGVLTPSNFLQICFSGDINLIMTGYNTITIIHRGAVWSTNISRMTNVAREVQTSSYSGWNPNTLPYNETIYTFGNCENPFSYYNQFLASNANGTIYVQNFSNARFHIYLSNDGSPTNAFNTA